jgi:hypothetical protein
VAVHVLVVLVVLGHHTGVLRVQLLLLLWQGC